MKTLSEIHKEAKNYAPDSEPLQDAFVAGARWMATGQYYKPAELFNEHQTVDLEVSEEPVAAQEDGIVPTFDEWWCCYAKKRGRKKAEAKWNKLSNADKIACMEATPAYVASTPDVTFRKDPITYLNGECWEDELIFKQDNEQQRNIQRAQRAARLIAGAYRQGQA